MRAAVFHRYGPPDVVAIRDIPAPTPRSDEVLVRVSAAAVTAADARLRGARFPRGFAPFARLAFGVARPRRRVLGSAFSGVVEQVGKRVSDWKPGDRVAGMTGGRFGAHAELLAVPASRLVATPTRVSHAEAAGLLFGGTTAWHFVGDSSHVAPGSRVLVVGAAGAVGTNAVQLAAYRGARVTAVTSGRNAALARDLGAVEVVDYETTDVERLGKRFDLVVDTVGALTRSTGLPLVAPGGQLVLVAADLWQTVLARGSVRAGVSRERTDVMATLLDLVAAGRLRVVVSHDVGLDDIVSAHRLVDSGRKVGNVVVRPAAVSATVPTAKQTCAS